MRRHRLQRRQHPIFSPVAIVSTVVFVVILGFGVQVAGGRAFSPGDLTGVNRSGEPIEGVLTHADFQDDCLECHAPFKGVDATRCEKCHQAVATERRLGEGLHGIYEMAYDCGACHPDHRGDDFDQVGAALTGLDHEITRFSLLRHRLDFSGPSIDCTACHAGGRDFSVLDNSCRDCHVGASPDFMSSHTGAFGSDCLTCHDGLDTLARFDDEQHAELFPLDGAHESTPCESCHAGGKFNDIAGDCAGCHLEPAIHSGEFGTDCALCHLVNGWKPAKLDGLSFDHGVDTSFELSLHIKGYDGLPFSCSSCHGLDQFAFAEEQCAACHAQAKPEFIESHIDQVGEACLACHDGSGIITNFDHDLVWPLMGKHSSVECVACHLDQQFAGTSGDCVSCHIEPDIHFGLFGTDCATCHTPEAWQPAMLTRHDFPLDHGDQGETPCAACHPATYADYTCYGCHEHEPVDIEQEHQEENIFPPDLHQCVTCHPNGATDEANSGP